MVATRVTCRGYKRDGSPQNGEASRLGHGSVQTTAATWRTFVFADVDAQGRVAIQVIRDGVRVHVWRLGPESGDDDEPRPHKPMCASRVSGECTCREHCPACDGGTLPEEANCEVCENQRTLPASVVSQMGGSCDCDDCREPEQ